MKLIISLLLSVFIAVQLQAQELTCRVQVIHRQIQGTNKQVFQTIQSSLNELMNQTRWTNNVFEYDERIECSIVLNITEMSGDEFKGYCQVQSRRPVYGTSYSSVVLNFKERSGDLHFRYNEGEQLVFNPNAVNHSLVSIMAFYAYMFIGMDYDTFGSESGGIYYQKAQRIVNDMQSSAFKGWKSFESLRNRYWLAEDHLNPMYGALRRCNYRYYRYGFDMMNDKLEQGRAEVAQSLRLLEKVQRNKPNSFLMQLWFTAHADELVQLFSQAPTSEKQRVYQIVSKLDPGNLDKYEKIKQ